MRPWGPLKSGSLKQVGGGWGCFQTCNQHDMNICVKTTKEKENDVCANDTPPENKTIREMSFQSTKSGAGEQFPPLDSMARARLEGAFLSQRTWAAAPKYII